MLPKRPRRFAFKYTLSKNCFTCQIKFRKVIVVSLCKAWEPASISLGYLGCWTLIGLQEDPQNYLTDLRILPFVKSIERTILITALYCLKSEEPSVESKCI